MSNSETKLNVHQSEYIKLLMDAAELADRWIYIWISNSEFKILESRDMVKLHSCICIYNCNYNYSFSVL